MRFASSNGHAAAITGCELGQRGTPAPRCGGSARPAPAQPEAPTTSATSAATRIGRRSNAESAVTAYRTRTHQIIYATLRGALLALSGGTVGRPLITVATQFLPARLAA